VPQKKRGMDQTAGRVSGEDEVQTVLPQSSGSSKPTPWNVAEGNADYRFAEDDMSQQR
jgi:hypothetical protein